MWHWWNSSVLLKKEEEEEKKKKEKAQRKCCAQCLSFTMIWNAMIQNGYTQGKRLIHFSLKTICRHVYILFDGSLQTMEELLKVNLLWLDVYIIWCFDVSLGYMVEFYVYLIESQHNTTYVQLCSTREINNNIIHIILCYLVITGQVILWYDILPQMFISRHFSKIEYLVTWSITTTGSLLMHFGLCTRFIIFR